MKDLAIRSVDIEFDNKKEEEEFLNWAKSKELDNSKEMKEMRQRLSRTREMRKKGKIVV